jgi:hypothetical protein
MKSEFHILLQENFNNVMESLTEARTHYKQQTQHAVTAVRTLLL